jgi:hypothetical protein
MLDDQLWYENTKNTAGTNDFDNGDIELTEENADDFIKYINSNF